MKASVFCLIFLFVLNYSDPASGQTCTPRSTLPTFCITTNGSAEIQKETYVNGTLKIIQEDAPEDLYDGTIRIRGRGNSTWGFSKKPYRINLDVEGSLLGMPATAKNWVLLANHADKTLIRNAVALEISRYIGMPYASPFRFVDVVLNGDYKGSYMLTDHMEVRKKRVDIQEGYGQSVPGAYLVEIDGFADQEPFHITTSRGLMASIKYPDLEMPQDAVRVNEILAHINDFESRLFSANPADGPGGYLERVDLESLVNWYIGNEITGNSDAFWSVYLHKRRSDDRFFLGPHWDFDIAFDNDNRINRARYRLMADVGHFKDFRQWIVQLRKDDVFMEAVKQRWNELKAEGFKSHILNKLNEYADLMISSGAQQQNFLRRPVLNTNVYLEVFLAPTYQEHVDFLYDYLSHRIDWFDRELNGLPSSFNYRIVNAGSNRALTVASSGTGVIQKDYVETPDFLWQIRPLSNGFYQIYNTGRDMALTRGSSAGTQLTLSTSNPDDPMQQWRITETSQGKYAIASRSGSHGVQNQTGSLSDDRPIHQIDFRDYHNHEIQGWLNSGDISKWTFTVVGEALPVSLAYFDAALAEGAVQLDWQVAEQVNSSHFEVERMGADRQKIILGTVPVEEEAGSIYRWTDTNPLPGQNYYRLKMVDNDGSFSYSKIVSVRHDPGKLLLKVYPNPAVNKVSADLFMPAPAGGYADLQVYNMTGLMVFEKREMTSYGVNSISLDTKGLSPGMYILKVRHGDSSDDARFVVVE